MKKLFYALVLALSLSACAQLGLTSPQSFDEKLAYSQSTVTSLRVAAATSLSAGSIKKADAEEVQKLADDARTLLDSARALEPTDISTATGKYALALGILTQLQAYTAARGIK